MYANDPISVRQLRTADLIAAEQSRSGRSPVSNRRGWIRRTVLDRIQSRRAQVTVPGTLLDAYGSHELFVGLDRHTLSRLSESFMVLDVEPGASLGRQGEAAPEFVVVLDGRIGVSLDGLPLVVLDAGSHFGALPLLDDGPMPYGRATFDVLEPARIAVAGRLDFAEMMAAHPVVAARVNAIADTRRAYLRGRADAIAHGTPAAQEFPLHMTDVR